MSAHIARILIIEDSTFIRESAAQHLKDKGYDVTACELQSKAEPLIKDGGSFDLILLDGFTDFVPNKLRGLAKDGDPSDAERLLQSGGNKEIPVVLISSQKALSVMLRDRFPQSVVGVYDKSAMDFGDMHAELGKLEATIKEVLDPDRQSQRSAACGR